jgi:hypothetical protein
VPQLLAQKRHPLLELGSGSVRDLAEQGLKRLAMARSNRSSISSKSGAALLCGWQTESYLKEAFHHPERVLSGLQGPRPFVSKAQLLLQAATGRW